jgi:hypothetical protein
MAVDKVLGVITVFQLSGEMTKAQAQKLKTLVRTALAIHYRQYLTPDAETSLLRKGKLPDGPSRSRDIRRGSSVRSKNSTH